MVALKDPKFSSSPGTSACSLTWAGAVLGAALEKAAPKKAGTNPGTGFLMRGDIHTLRRGQGAVAHQLAERCYLRG